ncbi:MAG: hypothetical protein M3280_07845 [Actinomycetota bacterium]|nr:hypothetical protein [Actinomycetota bacterium]
MIRSSLGKLSAWGGLASLSVLDQALVSGTNFAVHLLLARWLPPGEFGLFALIFSTFVIVAGFHEALVLEPMSVFGPSKYREDLMGYLTSLLRLQARFGVVPICSILLAAGASWVAGWQATGAALLGIGIAFPLMLVFLTLRRYFYLLSRPGTALSGGLLYLGATVTTLGLLAASSVVSPFMAFVALAMGSVVGSLLLALRAQRTRPDASSREWKQVPRDHWIFGRWLVVSSALFIASTQAQLFLAAGFLGLRAAGAFRAMQTLVLPFVQIVTAIGSLGLPVLSRDFGRGQLGAVRKKGMTIGLTLIAGAIAYEIALLVFRQPLEQLVYGGKFADFTWLLPVLGLLGILVALTTGYSLILRAVQRPKHYLFATSASALAGVTSAALFTWLWGLSGAAASLLLSYAAAAIAGAVLYSRWWREVL